MSSPLSPSPQVAVNDIGSAEDFRRHRFHDQYFNDGDIVEGTIVRRSTATRFCLTSVTRPKASFRPANSPSSTTSTPARSSTSAMRSRRWSSPRGQGRPPDPVQEARPVRARLGHDRGAQREGRGRQGHRHRGRQGGLILDIGLRGFLPASLVEMASRPRSAAVHRQGDRGQDHRARQEPQQRGALASRLAGADPVRGPQRVPAPAQKGQVRKASCPPSSTSAPSSIGRRRRPGPRVRAVVRAHRSPNEVVTVGDEVTVEVLSTSISTMSVSSRSRRPRRPVASVRPHPRDRSDRAGQGHQAGSVRRVRPRRRGASRAWSTSPSWPSAVEVPDQVVSPSATMRWSRSSTSTRASSDPLSLARPTRTTPGVRPVEVRHGRQLRRAGQLHLPRGFARDNEWLEGFDEQQKVWEGRYAEAERRHKMHTAQMEKFAKAAAEAENAPSDYLVDRRGQGAAASSARRFARERRAARRPRARLAGNA